MIYIVIGLVLAISYLACKEYLYRKTTYFHDTKKLSFSFYFDLGSYGEYLIYKYLRSFEKCGGKFLFNTYLTKENGQTTEVDVMLINEAGIFVFESKNYSGWIWGSEFESNWTQTLPTGRKSKKEHFLNPIIQNKVHIDNLKSIVGNDIPIYSIVTFSERCELKNITVSGENVHVVRRDEIKSLVSKYSSNKVIDSAKVNELYSMLYPMTQVSDDVKVKHISDIKENLTCPKCGGKLVVRTHKSGANANTKFYGCSNYPKCRYRKNLL